MARSVLRVLVALALLAAAFAVAPEFWRGRVSDGSFPRAEAQAEPIDLDDAELVLGALVIRAWYRMGAPKEWVMAIERDDAVRQTMTAFVHCTPPPPRYMRGAGASSLERLDQLRGIAEHAQMSAAAPPQDYLARTLVGIEEILEEGYDERTVELNRATVRYLESRGSSHVDALRWTLYIYSGRKWTSPAGQMSTFLKGFHRHRLTQDEELQLQRLEVRLDELASRSVISPAEANAARRAQQGNQLRLVCAWLGAALTSTMILAWVWLLLAWVLLRRRSDVVGEPGPPAWWSKALLIALPLAGGLLGLLGADEAVALLAMLGLAIGVSVQARARGASERTGAPHSLRLHAAVVVLMITVVTVLGRQWAEVLLVRTRTLDELAVDSVLCAAIVGGTGMLATAFLWARPAEGQSRRLLWAVAVAVVGASVLSSALGLTSVLQGIRLMRTPLGGAVWVLVLGVVYWFVRGLAGRSRFRFDSRRLVAHRLVPPLALWLALVITLVPHTWRWVDFIPAAIILTALLLLIVLADGALASSATRDGAGDPSFATRTAAWTAALADGILLASLALLACSVWAQRAIDQQTAQLEWLLGLR